MLHTCKWAPGMVFFRPQGKLGTEFIRVRPSLSPLRSAWLHLPQNQEEKHFPPALGLELSACKAPRARSKRKKRAEGSKLCLSEAASGSPAAPGCQSLPCAPKILPGNALRAPDRISLSEHTATAAPWPFPAPSPPLHKDSSLPTEFPTSPGGFSQKTEQESRGLDEKQLQPLD